MAVRNYKDIPHKNKPQSNEAECCASTNQVDQLNDIIEKLNENIEALEAELLDAYRKINQMTRAF